MVVPDTTSASKALSKPNELSMVLILFSGILQYSFNGADKFVTPNKQHTYNFHTNDKVCHQQLNNQDVDNFESHKFK